MNDINLINNAINSVVMPSTCQLFLGNETTRSFEPIASGVFVEIDAKYYLWTAAHVTHDADDESNLFVRVHGGYLAIVGNLRETDLSKHIQLDVAFMSLDPKVCTHLKRAYRFLTFENLEIHNELDQDRYYCVYGFPVKATKKEDGKFKSKAMAYFLTKSKSKVYNYYRLEMKDHYILNYAGVGRNIFTEEKTKTIIEPRGLSGGGLWCFDFDDTNGKLSAIPKLIGIMTELRNDKFQCLIANQIQLMLSGMQEFDKIIIPKSALRIK